jgi:hypothetical protein
MWLLAAERTLAGAEVEAMDDAPLTKLAQAEGGSPLAGAPRTVDCLRCQLYGRRRLFCSEADACSSLPIVFPLGPILLAGWAVTAIAFYFAVR